MMFDKAFYWTLARIVLNSAASILVSKAIIAPEQGAYITDSANIDALLGVGGGALAWYIGLKKAATTISIPKSAANPDDRSR